MVGECAGALLARVRILEPFCEGGVSPRALRLRQAVVRHIAGERVLEDELGLGGPDETALDERSHLGCGAGDGGKPGRGERTADHGGRLQRIFRRRREKVDARGEHTAD